MSNSLIETVYNEGVLPMMLEEGIEDTPTNRYYVLQGLVDGWTEDTSDDCLEKSLYVVAVRTEMMRLSFGLQPAI